MEFERRDAYKEKIGLYAFGNDSSPFSRRLICSHCGKPWMKPKREEVLDVCFEKGKRGQRCQADSIFEESIFEAFRVTWNGVIANKDKLTEKWMSRLNQGYHWKEYEQNR